MISSKASLQNLILNGSFEEHIDFETENKNGWNKLQSSDTPDYFNFENQTNVFKEYFGGTNPKSGTGFVGIFCYRISPQRSIKNVREFIETGLTETLEKDSIYEFEISLCLDAESNFAVKNFGIYFSNTPLYFEKDNKCFTLKPQIEFNSTFIDNTSGWITLKSYYTANGTEKYIIIGNFKTDKSTVVKSIKIQKEKKMKKKWDLEIFESAAYYYIDDVILEKVRKKTHITPIFNTPVLNLTDTFNLDDIAIDSAIVLNNIIFEFNKSDLMPQSYPEIEKLYSLLNSNPIIRIRLEGHTDNIGGYDFNLQLSLKRVQSVVKYLIDKGISPDRIEYAGYSYSCPLVSNDTEEGRKLNRRVVFKILNK